MNWIVDQIKKINLQPIQFYKFVHDCFALFSNQHNIFSFYLQPNKIHVDIQFIDLLSYKGNLRALYACLHE